MKTWQIDAKELRRLAPMLRAGDQVLLSGEIYTARDAAHKRMMASLNAGKALPFPLEGACIYFAGPTPAPAGMAIGSCGPTTSGRMDPYTPTLMDCGLVATIGKGARSQAVCESIVRNQGVYFCSIGGAGALAAQCIKRCEVIAYNDLGCESIKKLTVSDFPLIVAVDCMGADLFVLGRAQYAQMQAV
ncbi:FumA C-terminus/TtdB family hydratase beta subunit [Anaerotruncus colihominis]|uniref:FumA C-terminus/TtdB family hydratase beta subunit n=1 Tax=Anaerotruncus colihominis TaxID=169435 RepID=UPI0017491B01|nr:FumA C-terminus/TtdB family hydratase beta subunit [Anaerotruncus colihominis]